MLWMSQEALSGSDVWIAYNVSLNELQSFAQLAVEENIPRVVFAVRVDEDGQSAAVVTPPMSEELVVQDAQNMVGDEVEKAMSSGDESITSYAETSVINSDDVSLEVLRSTATLLNNSNVNFTLFRYREGDLIHGSGSGSSGGGSQVQRPFRIVTGESSLPTGLTSGGRDVKTFGKNENDFDTDAATKATVTVKSDGAKFSAADLYLVC